MQIVKLDDYEWWIGESVEACVKAHQEQTGGDDEQYEYACALSDAELDGLKFIDSDEDERPIGECRTFREQLAREVEQGGEFPRLFASTDY